MKERFTKKLIEVDNETWKDLRYIKSYYGRQMPWVINDALREYIKNKKKEIEKSHEN